MEQSLQYNPTMVCCVSAHEGKGTQKPATPLASSVESKGTSEAATLLASSVE